MPEVKDPTIFHISQNLAIDSYESAEQNSLLCGECAKYAYDTRFRCVLGVKISLSVCYGAEIVGHLNTVAWGAR